VNEPELDAARDWILSLSDTSCGVDASLGSEEDSENAIAIAMAAAANLQNP